MLQQTHFPLKQCLFFICLLCYLLLVLCFLSLILNWLIKLEDILHFHGTSMKISNIYFYSYLTFRLHFVKIFLIIACDCLYIDFKNLRTHNLALAVVSGGIINRWILFYTNAGPCSRTWNCVHLLVSQQTADFFFCLILINHFMCIQQGMIVLAFFFECTWYYYILYGFNSCFWGHRARYALTREQNLHSNKLA